MRIGVEACTWANRRGYGRFTRELVAAMVAGHPEHQFVLVVDDHTARECVSAARISVKARSTCSERYVSARLLEQDTKVLPFEFTHRSRVPTS